MREERLDQALPRRGLCESREMAKRLILAGEVRIEGMSGLLKPGSQVEDDAKIVVKSRPKFVSRGGLKIEKALDEFSIDVAGMVGLDAGASTGGFTDCVLRFRLTLLVCNVQQCVPHANDRVDFRDY